ncbi:MAG: hypothetical protein U1F98_14755 [Verrucomicrobiota bacterium]
MKKMISVVSGCLVGLAALAADSSTAQVFQMRLVADNSSSQTERMTLVQSSPGNRQPEIFSVQKAVLLDQADLKSATVSTNTPTGAPRIDLVFTEKGAQRFAEVTRQNIGKRLAIVIDGRLYSAPYIRAEIAGGLAQIEGSFTEQEARDLAAAISKTLQK